MTFRGDYFDRQYTDRLKGIAAMLIVVHHLYQHTALTTNWGVLSPIMQYFGYGLVAVFFFISGYGITLSASKKNDYIHGFLLHRVLPIFLLYCFLIILYLLTDWALSGILPTGWHLLQSFFIGKTIVSHGWFFQSILFFYLCFWLSWRVSQRFRFIILAVALGIYILVCVLCDTPISYYISTPVFYLGCLFAAYKELVDLLCSRFLLTIGIVTFSLTVFFFIGRNLFSDLPSSILLGTLNIFFITSIVVFIMFIPIRGHILDILATISLEIYYIQGVAFKLLRNEHWHLSSDILFITSGILLTIVLAYCFRPITIRIMALPSIKRIGKRYK